jgi:predicted ATPase
LAHLSVESIGALERGARRAPYRETVALLADALGLSSTDRADLEAAAAAARARGTRREAAVAIPMVAAELPLQSTSFVGRQRDIAELTNLVTRNRLVTITGSGGVGKTRVLIEVAGRLPSAMRDLVRFVDLSRLNDGGSIVGEIALRVGVSSTSDASTVDGLARALRTVRALVVLDNCEHVIADVALLVATVLRSSPHVSFLTTSRERLAVDGEIVYRLPSLDVPHPHPAGIEEARRSSAVELFVQRATAIDRSVTFDDASVASIVDICRRLDGIPLAIELAASRLPALGLESLRARLSDGILATAGARSLPARQRTMLATIEWSYGLLDDAERIVLQNVAVFVGGFTLAAAESVCVGDGIAPANVADVLASLVDKCLINVTLSDGRARYSMLESVKAFARRLLADAGRVDELALRHAEWCAAFADGIDTARVGKSEGWLRTETAPELENARAAIAWALENAPARALLAGRIVGGLRTIWLTSGRRWECMRLAEAALNAIDEDAHPQVVARLLRALIQANEVDSVWVKRGLIHFRRIGDRVGTALLHAHLAFMENRAGRIDEAEEQLSQARTILAGVPRSMPHAVFLQTSWRVHFAQRRYDEALSDIDEGIAIVKLLGDTDAFRWVLFRTQVLFELGERERAVRDADLVLQRTLPRAASHTNEIIVAYSNLALYRLAGGELDEGSAAAREALVRTRRWEGADELVCVATYLGALAAALRGEARVAAKLLGAAESRFGESDAYVWRYRDTLLMPPLLERLTPEELDVLRTAGRTQTRDAIIDEAISVLR